MLSLPHRPAQTSQGDPSHLPSLSASESYYSAQDIEVLHHVVTTAQEDLDSLPEGERLATNALFKAYDMVLPRYGIDPEQDHHLSRLVFRVGGERGDGSLSEKFRAVLARMGIELEFEADVTTRSMETMSDSGSYSPASVEKYRVQGHYSRGAIPDTDEPFSALNKAIYLSRHPFSKPHQRPSQGNSSGLRSSGESHLAGLTKSSPMTAGRGHDTNAHGVTEQGSAIGAVTSGGGLDPSRPVPYLLAGDTISREAGPTFDHQPPTQVPTPTQASESGNQMLEPHQRRESLHTESVLVTKPQLDSVLKNDTKRWSHLQRRASRAWGLFQLTKAVSHWNIWAEEKLDRVEVARRHMSRYRHFGSWRDKTIDTMQYSRRLLLIWSNSIWQHAVKQTHIRREQAGAKSVSTSIDLSLTHWASLISVDPRAPVRRSKPPLVYDSAAQWWAYASRVEDMSLRAGHSLCNVCIQPSLAGWQSVLNLHRHNVSLARQRVLQDVLWHWDLICRSRTFANGLAQEGARRVISQWRSLGYGRSPLQWRAYQDQLGAPAITRSDGAFLLTTVRRHILLGDCLSKWQSQTSDHLSLSHRACSLSTFVNTHHAIASWNCLGHNSDTLQLWSSRADRFLTIGAYLTRARQVARPSWSHTTRTLYARARWRQKHLNVRWLISSWKRQTRSTDGLDGAAHDSEVEMSARRLIQTLHSWQEECAALLASEWSTYLPSSWLNEWAVLDELLHLLRDDATASWRACLRSKTYNKWRALSVQFHSQSYVVGDVVEKNSRKLTRRILLHWRKSGSGVMPPLTSRTASQSTQHPSILIWPRTQIRPAASSSLMEFGDVPSQEESPPYASAEQNDILNTPTRWTGLGSSLTRLPTTTPQVPLSTPFERALRNHYNQNMSSTITGVPPHVNQTPRLSAVEARRIAEERRRHR